MDDATREHLREGGWFVHELDDVDDLGDLQHLLDPELARHEWVDDDERLRLVADLTVAVTESGLVHRLLVANAGVFCELLGPDVDVQAAPHLRVVRPGREGDQVSWHRDSFYGAGAHEMSCWIPLAELGEGAGLRLVPGSHRMPSRNLRSVEDDDEFRRSVTKGSTAHDIGFPYAPKADDVSASASDGTSVLVRPPVGSCVIFWLLCCIRGRVSRRGAAGQGWAESAEVEHGEGDERVG